jgi:hypothetical protein
MPSDATRVVTGCCIRLEREEWCSLKRDKMMVVPFMKTIDMNQSDSECYCLRREGGGRGGVGDMYVA